MTNEELLTTLKAVRGLFANTSPFYISKLGGPITNADQSRIDAVFIAVDAAIASEGVSASPQPRPYKDGDALKWFEDYCYEHHINFAKRIETGGEESERLDELVLEILEAFLSQFFAAAPAQEPRPAPMEREALAVELFSRHRMRHNGRTRNQSNLLSMWELLSAYERLVWLDTAADVQNIIAVPPREGPPFCTAEHPDDFIFCHRPEGHAGNHKNNHINIEWADTPQETPER